MTYGLGRIGIQSRRHYLYSTPIIQTLISYVMCARGVCTRVSLSASHMCYTPHICVSSLGRRLEMVQLGCVEVSHASPLTFSRQFDVYPRPHLWCTRRLYLIFGVYLVLWCEISLRVMEILVWRESKLVYGFLS